jgi:lysozyme
MAGTSRALMTEYGLSKLKEWEGLRLNAYADVGGTVTIGYGHTGPDVRMGMVIDEAQADQWLRQDIAFAAQAVDRLVSVPLSAYQRDALISFVYNVGANAFAKSTLLRKLNAGDYAAVPAELARWNKAGGKVVEGLVNRRAAEAGLWAKGEPVVSAPVTPDEGDKPVLASTTIQGGFLGAAGGAIGIAMQAKDLFDGHPTLWAAVLAGCSITCVGLGVWMVITGRLRLGGLR